MMNITMNNLYTSPLGEVINFNNLIIAIFEFVQSMTYRKKFTNLLDNLLPELMYYLIIFMQITPDQIQLWTDNPNRFVEEDEQCFIYNVRISAQELLSVSGNFINAIEALFSRVRGNYVTCRPLSIISRRWEFMRFATS